jgi:hypothetical protein
MKTRSAVAFADTKWSAHVMALRERVFKAVHCAQAEMWCEAFG